MQLLSSEQSVLLSLISAYLNDEPNISLPKETDILKLSTLAVAQGIEVLVFSAFEKYKITDGVNAIISNYAYALKRSLLQSSEAERLFYEFEKHGIKYMPVKGYVIRKYYPFPEMRSYADIDILYDKSDMQRVNEVMDSLGYALKIEDENVNSFTKKSVNIEMHYSLFKQGSSAFNFFGNALGNAEKTTDFRYEMSPEDTVIFLVAHSAKHFTVTGTGIRNLIDIHLLLKSETNIDNNYLSKSLQELNLTTYFEKILKLNRIIFEGETPDNDDLILLNYFLSNGIYGTVVNFQCMKMIQAKSSVSSFIFRRIFPSVGEMKSNYPLLKKCILLLPLFWIIRIFTAVFKRNKNVKRILRDGKKLNSQNISELKESLDICNLRDFK